MLSPLFQGVVAQFVQMEKELNNFNEDIYYNIFAINRLDLIDNMWFLKILFFSAINFILFVGLMKVEIKKRIQLFIFGIIQIIVLAFLFDKVIYVLFFLIVCLFILNIFINTLHINAYLAKFLVETILFILNFIIEQKFIFNERCEKI